MSVLSHNRTTVTNINYHLVWSTKRRRRVLVPDLARNVKIWAGEAASAHGFTVHMIEIGNRDHVHALVSAPTTVTISSILHALKGYTARMAFKKYAFLGRAYPKRHMWNPSSYVETIGCISEGTIRKYIEHQEQDGHTERKGGASRNEANH